MADLVRVFAGTNRIEAMDPGLGQGVRGRRASHFPIVDPGGVGCGGGGIWKEGGNAVDGRLIAQ
ncbi:MAG TPA: hypothetical protein DEV93_19345 [Chloroflexi bacterium]|nr:hypothetical protein [Chloroflexota bacterium]